MVLIHTSRSLAFFLIAAMAFVEENEPVSLLISFLEPSDVVRARICHVSGSLMIGSRRPLVCFSLSSIFSRMLSFCCVFQTP